MVLEEKPGVTVPLLGLNPERSALDDTGRVTVMVYVLVVEPSCAVTTVVIVFAPTAKAIGADAVPDATVVPFTFIVAVFAVLVGVTVIVETVPATVSV